MPASATGDTRAIVVGEDAGAQIRMAYTEAGDPSATQHLLLLHGLFDNRGTWDYVLPHLVEAGYHIIAPDLVGCGDSSKPELASLPSTERYSLDTQVGFVRRFTECLGLDDLVLVGHSLGGGIALRSLCTEWPGAPRVRGLVLESAAGHAQGLPARLRLLAEWPGRLLTHPWVHALALATGGAQRIARATFRHVFHDPDKIPKELVDRAVDIVRDPRTLAAYRDTARNLLPADIATFPDRYRDIDVPTLIVWGRDDRIVPPLFGLLFEAEIPGSTLHVFDECGHAPHLEYPVETAVLLRDWMRGHLARD